MESRAMGGWLRGRWLASGREGGRVAERGGEYGWEACLCATWRAGGGTVRAYVRAGRTAAAVCVWMRMRVAEQCALCLCSPLHAT